MINNETIVTAGLFGTIAGITTQSLIAIIVGALAVGVVQPFFRVFWTKKLNKHIRKYKNTCSTCKGKIDNEN